jgi:hypothetical protein
MEYVTLNKIEFSLLLKRFNKNVNEYKELLINPLDIEIYRNGKIYIDNKFYKNIEINFNEILEYLKHKQVRYISNIVHVRKNKYVIQFLPDKYRLYKNNTDEDNFILSSEYNYNCFNEQENINYVRHKIKEMM